MLYKLVTFERHLTKTVRQRNKCFSIFEKLAPKEAKRELKLCTDNLHRITKFVPYIVQKIAKEQGRKIELRSINGRLGTKYSVTIQQHTIQIIGPRNKFWSILRLICASTKELLIVSTSKQAIWFETTRQCHETIHISIKSEWDLLVC